MRQVQQMLQHVFAPKIGKEQIENMKEKAKKMLLHKEKTVPILSFPSTQLLNISVRELISSSEMQSCGMQAIAARCNVGASLNMMDLSVEAEAFGAKVRFAENEIPTVVGGVLSDIRKAKDLVVPTVGSGRTGRYIEGVKKAKESIKNIPVFCGVIGPYSLAGHLFDMSELMMECYDNPEQVAILLDKTTQFLIAYIKAFIAAGADGVILAEPAAGMLSPALAADFSTSYVQRIIDAVQSEDFLFCYHNCGNAVVDMIDCLAKLDADIFHFGNAVDLPRVLARLPKDRIVMGNIDPVLFKTGTPEQIREATEAVYHQCAQYSSFMISSGCDIPAEAKWENIDAYFEKVRELYA